MPLIVTDPSMSERLLAERQASGGDRYDEVWEGDYVMSPLPGDEHQEIVCMLASILNITLGFAGLAKVRAGTNLSDREQDWQGNYRVPDIAVKLPAGNAQILESHWRGGPDFLVEVLSEGDRAREKLPFYAAIGTREVLIVDRDPWALELYGLQHGQLLPVCASRPEKAHLVESSVLPFTFELLAAEKRPRLCVSHTITGQTWVF